MSNTNLRRYFSDIQETLPKGIKDIDVEEQKEQTLAQVRMDLELLQMMHDHIKNIRQKKEAIANIQATIKARNAVISEFTELVSTMSDQFKKLGDQSTKENCYLYSPYNNTKPLSSFEILNYAKKISHSLQAPKNYVPDSLLPNNFVLPFPTEDHIFHTYIYFNSRTDGKVAQKCQTPHHSITNKMDIITNDGKTYHMIQPAAVLITANDPKDCTIIYTMDGSVPIPFAERERQMGNGETIDVNVSCTLQLMACKPGFLDSDILELEFIIDKIDEQRANKGGVNQAEWAQRPDILADTKITGGIEFLDTPYSMGRTPSYAFTPSYTPSYYRESSSKDQGDH